jgi:hypothetical protein
MPIDGGKLHNHASLHENLREEHIAEIGITQRDPCCIIGLSRKHLGSRGGSFCHSA